MKVQSLTIVNGTIIKSIYVACPLTVEYKYLAEVISTLKLKYNVSVNFHERDTKYSKDKLINADAIVVILPERGWKSQFSDIPSGIKSEICFFMDNNMPIFLAYWRTYRFSNSEENTDLQFYSTNLEFNTSGNLYSAIFTGVASTTNLLGYNVGQPVGKAIVKEDGIISSGRSINKASVRNNPLTTSEAIKEVPDMRILFLINIPR